MLAKATGPGGSFQNQGGASGRQPEQVLVAWGPSKPPYKDSLMLWFWQGQFKVSQGGLRAEHQLLNNLQAELDAARREAEALRLEAAAAAVLRNELAARTASLAAARDLLLRLEAERTEELQVSVARYAELEEALAQAEQSIEHVVDEQLVKDLEVTVARLQAEVEATSSQANALERQLQQAQQGREAAEQAQQEAMARATQLQQQADTLARQLASSRGEAAYRMSEAAAEGCLRVEAELEAARREADALQEAMHSMRVEIEANLTAADRGGRDAALHRNRAHKLQAQLSLHRLRAEAAAGRVVEHEAAAKQQAAVLGTGLTDQALASTSLSALLSQKEVQQKEALAKALSRLQHLEGDVQRARDECNDTKDALARAMRGQHAAEQAQRAAQEQLAQQAAALLALERALSEQAATAESSMHRERHLEGQLAQRAQLADEAEKRALQLARRLRECQQQAAASADQAAVAQGQLEEATARACSAEALAGEKQAGLRVERSRAEEAARRANLAEAQLVQWKVAAQEVSRQATALAQELRARLEEERAQSQQLEGALGVLRGEYERTEGDLQALSMQLQRAQQQEERIALQFTLARDELAAVKAQLANAMAEIELMHQADALKAAHLTQANTDSQALAGEVERLAEAVADKDAALLRWRQEAEEATELAQAALEAQEAAVGVVEKLQEELAWVNGEREGQRATVAALCAQVKDAQADSQAVRGELEATREIVQGTDLQNKGLQEQAEREVVDVHRATRSSGKGAEAMAAHLTEGAEEKGKHGAAAPGSFRGQAAPGQDRQQAALKGPPAEDFVPAHEVMALLDDLDTLQSQLEAAKFHAEVTAARAKASEQRAGSLQAELDYAARRAAEAEERLAELEGHLEAVLGKAEAADVGVGRRMRGLLQELAAAKAAAKAAEAAAEKLAGEKAALLQELAFGRAAAKGAPAAASPYTPRLPSSIANSALITWRSKD
ncbi:hypothetical protein N2152v2_006222 [Parachlorella kessleri]